MGYLQRSTGRTITVTGPLEVHLAVATPQRFSARSHHRQPTLDSRRHHRAQIDLVRLVYDLPQWGHPQRIESLRMQGANLTLFRDAAGHANWQRRNPDAEQSGEGDAVYRRPDGEAMRTWCWTMSGGICSLTVPCPRKMPLRSDGSAALQIQGTGVTLNGASCHVYS